MCSESLRRHNNIVLMAIVAALIAQATIYIYGESYDNDIWFILATGREIVESGIPYVNPFTIHDGMGIVVQQWIPAVIAWQVYSLFGFTGLGILTVVGITAIVLLLYRLGRTLRGDEYGGEWILICILTIMPALAAYLSMRPHFYTMIIFAALLNCLEMYRRTTHRGWLIAVCALVLIHGNIHMAMAPFDIVIIVCYALPDPFALTHRRGHMLDLGLAHAFYPRIPVAICAAVSSVLLAVNPYGLYGALYLVSSYGAADYDGYIREMGALKLTSDWAVDMVVCFVLAVFAIVFIAARSSRKFGVFTFDMPQILLFAGCSFLAFQHIRNVWLGAFFAYPILVSATAGWSVEAPWKSYETRRMVVAGLASALITVGVVVGLNTEADSVTSPIRDSKNIPAKAVEYLNGAVENRGELRLFNHFTSGGYLEFNGYKTLIDPRPELWNSAITGLPEDYYFEYVDFIRGRSSTQDYIESYDFDYLIVDEDTDVESYLTSRNDYGILVEGNGYKLWQHIRPA